VRNPNVVASENSKTTQKRRESFSLSGSRIYNSQNNVNSDKFIIFSFFSENRRPYALTAAFL